MTGAVEAVATAEGLALGETVRVLVDLDFALRDAGADRDALVERDTDRHEAVSWSGEENVEALAVGVEPLVALLGHLDLACVGRHVELTRAEFGDDVNRTLRRLVTRRRRGAEGGGEIAEGTRGGGEIAEGACNLGIEEERLVECGGNVRGVRALEGGARVAERLEDTAALNDSRTFDAWQDSRAHSMNSAAEAWARLRKGYLPCGGRAGAASGVGAATAGRHSKSSLARSCQYHWSSSKPSYATRWRRRPFS